MAETFTLARAIEMILRDRLAEVRVSLPGEVVSYDASKREADIKLDVKRRIEDEDGNEVEEEYPTIPHVRVCHPQGGGFHASFPLSAGDKVMLVFADFSLDDLRAGREGVAPSDRAAHHLANAWCYPGGVDPDDSVLSGASDTQLIVGKAGGPELAVDDSHVKLGDRAASEFVALANLVKDRLDTIQSAFDSHAHGGSTSDGATISDPTTAMEAIGSLSGVAASKTKAK